MQRLPLFISVALPPLSLTHLSRVDRMSLLSRLAVVVPPCVYKPSRTIERALKLVLLWNSDVLVSFLREPPSGLLRALLELLSPIPFVFEPR